MLLTQLNSVRLHLMSEASTARVSITPRSYLHLTLVGRRLKVAESSTDRSVRRDSVIPAANWGGRILPADSDNRLVAFEKGESQ